MVHVAGVEAIEVVEAEAVGPAVERAGGARLPCRRVVVLADPRRHVSVLPQHLADGPAAARQHAGVAVVARGRLGDAAERGGLVIAAGDERGAGRAAEGGRVEAVVAQPLGREPVHRRDGTPPPNVLNCPKPASSMRISTTLGAPFGACTGCGNWGGSESRYVRPTVPGKWKSGR